MLGGEVIDLFDHILDGLNVTLFTFFTDSIKIYAFLFTLRGVSSPFRGGLQHPDSIDTYGLWVR